MSLLAILNILGSEKCTLILLYNAVHFLREVIYFLKNDLLFVHGINLFSLCANCNENSACCRMNVLRTNTRNTRVSLSSVFYLAIYEEQQKVTERPRALRPTYLSTPQTRSFSSFLSCLSFDLRWTYFLCVFPESWTLRKTSWEGITLPPIFYYVILYIVYIISWLAKMLSIFQRAVTFEE